MAIPLAKVRQPRPMPAWKINFYRQCRVWHGWLSAFAFIALMFFSGTGLLLNHPEWFAGEAAPSQESKAAVAVADIRRGLAAPQPVAALSEILVQQKLVGGIFASGDVEDDEAYLRFEGVSGNTSVTLNLKSGSVAIARQRASVLTILNDLHRGKNAGQAWKWLIDVSAGIFFALSLVGYILFFSLRRRLVISLGLTAVSLAVLAGFFLMFVP